MIFGPLSMYSLPEMALGPGSLAVERDLAALLTSSMVGESARLALITTS